MLSKHRRGFPRSVFKTDLAGLFAFFLFTFSPPGRAAAILFTATDVADTTPGQDLWEYSYIPADFTFAAGQGFTIGFERTRFTLLQSPPPFVNADWEPISLQPDLLLGSNGFYDALALRSAPSLADPFKVQAVWLGSGAPGPQPFTIYDTNFQPLAQGQTIPEPSALALVFAAAAAPVSRRGLPLQRRAGSWSEPQATKRAAPRGNPQPSLVTPESRP